MAFATNAVILEALTQENLGSSSASVADAAFSVAGDVVQFTNTSRAVAASFVLRVNYSVAPDANSGIKLFARLMNIVSTADAPIPDANFEEIPMGVFWVNDVTVQQDLPIGITRLPVVNQAQVIEYYIKNETGQTIPASWILYTTPFAILPAA